MNSMGERIYNLRKQKNMSQGDLANALDISRQTVSKWENNQSIPEIEKLSALSEIFGVSIDYIVSGKVTVTQEVIKEEPKTETQEKQENVPLENVAEKQKLTGVQITGIVLSIIGGFVFMFCIYIDLHMLSLIGVWLFIIGMILIFLKNYRFLISSWVSFILAERFSVYFTSVNMRMVFRSYYYIESLYAQIVVAYVMWIILAALIIATIVTITKRRKLKKQKLSKKSKFIISAVLSVVILISAGSVAFIATRPVSFDAGACGGGYETYIFDKYSQELLNEHTPFLLKDNILSFKIANENYEVDWIDSRIFIYFDIEYVSLSEGIVTQRVSYTGNRIWTDTFKWRNAHLVGDE